MLLVLLFAFWDKQEMTRSLNQKIEQESQKLKLKNEFAINYFDPLITDIHFLSKTVSILQHDDDTLHVQEIVDAFNTFMSLNPDYYQLRILDNDGMEKVKWVRRGNELERIPVSKLQNKSSREYVKNSLGLEPNEVYISRVVLNMENGEIEVPYQPVVRFSAPIYNKQGKNLGMVIANYDVSVFIDKQESYQRMVHCQYSLIESHGYWILSPQPDRAWGFMFADTTKRFQEYYPSAWQAMQREPSGSIDVDSGLIVYEMFDLTDSLQKLTRSKDLEFRVTDRRQVYSVSFLPQAYVNDVKFEGRGVYLPFFALIAIGYAVSSFLWARSKVLDIKQRLELKVVNQRLLKQKDLLTQQNTELERFTHIAAHDLQEPLRTIRSYLGWITKAYTDAVDEKGQKGMQYVIAAVQRMESMITSLRELHKQNAQTQLEEVDTLELVNDIVSDLRSLIEEREANIKIPRALPTISADKVKMKLVFQNLLINAMLHTDEGVTPDITVEHTENDDDYIFMIKDNATTIDPKHYERIFQVFYRSKRTDDDDTGMGMGLTIVANLIKQHSGRVWVEPNNGQGNIFKFSIPKNSNSTI